MMGRHPQRFLAHRFLQNRYSFRRTDEIVQFASDEGIFQLPFVDVDNDVRLRVCFSQPFQPGSQFAFVDFYAIGPGKRASRYETTWPIGPLAWLPRGDAVAFGIGMSVHFVGAKTGRRGRLFGS